MKSSNKKKKKLTKELMLVTNATGKHIIFFIQVIQHEKQLLP